jgi:lysophospholipase L1-like esterase
MMAQMSYAQAPATQPGDAAPGARRGNRTPTYLPINPNLPTLWIIGDSTVRNGTMDDGNNGQWGWGNPIRHYFDETKVNIQNRAFGGTSSSSFHQSHWPAVVELIKPGDSLIMQFGHNDSGTPKGNDDDLHDGRGGQVHSFGWNLRNYITEAKAKGAVDFVICSPIPRDRWTDGKIPPDNWTTTCKEAAETSGAKFLNLNALIIEKYTPLGQEKVDELYFPEHDTQGRAEATHTNWAGAVLNAECVIEGLKQINSPLVKYLKPEPPKDLKNPTGRAK